MAPGRGQSGRGVAWSTAGTQYMRVCDKYLTKSRLQFSYPNHAHRLGMYTKLSHILYLISLDSTPKSQPDTLLTVKHEQFRTQNPKPQTLNPEP